MGWSTRVQNQTISRRRNLSSPGANASALAFFLFCASELFLAQGESLSLPLKISGCLLLILSMLSRPKLDKRIVLFVPLLIFFLIGLYKSFYYPAGLEELLRFILPIVILINLHHNSKSIEKIAYLFVLITISNNLYQIYAYLAFIINLPTFLPVRLEAGYIIRAEGWVGFFSLFGFMNFCAFLIVRHTNIFKKNQRALSLFFLAFMVLSTSTKVLVGLIIYAIAIKKNRNFLKISIATTLAIFIIFIAQPKLATDMLSVLDTKVGFYITQGNSARSESYRVMFESLAHPNFLGEGLGSFGGPASTKFDSPLYEKYNFNWYGLEDQLATTDTLYPHVFVELGIFGGLLYLFFIFTYGFRKATPLWIVIAFSFALDNLASFSMLSPPYFYGAALCMLMFSKGTTTETRGKNQHKIHSPITGRPSCPIR